MQTRESVLWLKRKLKSFLMNNVTHYFTAAINNKDYAQKTLNKLYIAAAEKYVACCQEFASLHQKHKGFPVDLKVAQVLYVVIRSFFKYLVCNVRMPIYKKEDYLEFFTTSIHIFVLRFQQAKGQFRGAYRILRAKEEALKRAKTLEFVIK